TVPAGARSWHGLPMSGVAYTRRLPGEPLSFKQAVKWFWRRQDERRVSLTRRFGKHDPGLVWKYTQIDVRMRFEEIFDGLPGVGRSRKEARAGALKTLRELDAYEIGRLQEGK